MASDLNPPQSSSPTGDGGRMSSTSTATNTSANAVPELTVVIDDLLNQLSNKFAGVSSEIFAKMDEMSRRLDNLEQNMQASDESGNSTSSPTKT